MDITFTKTKSATHQFKENIVLSDYTLPDGIQYEDDFFGKTEIIKLHSLSTSL
jgi:Thiol:disulfide interchange protein